MKIAILSGKGGTGKTLLAVNLAYVADKSRYMDFDVEEPNGDLYFKVQDPIQEEISVKIPQVDMSLCNACKKCVDFCEFNALALVGDELIVFETICHSCGGCVLVCPEDALTEKDKPIGRIEHGYSKETHVVSGIMNVGEVSGIPILESMMEDRWEPVDYSFIDCPPGSSCSAMESIKGADYCLVVVEPTLFGLHNFEMIHDLLHILNKPYSAIINKVIEDDNAVIDSLKERDIKILAKIPFDKDLGKLNSDGHIASELSDKYFKLFKKILDDLVVEVNSERTVGIER